MKTEEKDSPSQFTVVLPGDDVTSHVTEIQSRPSSLRKKKPIKLGRGLKVVETPTREGGEGGKEKSNNEKNIVLPNIKCTLAGRLQYNPSSHTIYILTNTKRYVPQIHDRIICIIEDRMGDYYRVTIPGCTIGSNVILNSTSFEGATKRNRPYLGNGDLVYARVVTCFDFSSEIEISCTVNRGRDDVQKGTSSSLNDDGGASRKDWMTDEGTYGQLKRGTCIQVSTGLAQELLHPNNVVLQSLGTSGIRFEICIGVNGYVWVQSERPEYTILILNAIQNSEVMTETQVRAMVKALVKTVRQSILEEE